MLSNSKKKLRKRLFSFFYLNKVRTNVRSRPLEMFIVHFEHFLIKSMACIARFFHSLKTVLTYYAFQTVTVKFELTGTHSNIYCANSNRLLR